MRTKHPFVKIIKKSRSEKQDFLKGEIRSLFGCAYNTLEISSMLGIERKDVLQALKDMGLRYKAPYESIVTLQKEPRPRMALMNSHAEDHGKSNPFIAAEMHPDMRQHFETVHGMKFYKGKRLNTYAEWTPVMRDYNAIMREHGGKVLDYLSDWVT